MKRIRALIPLMARQKGLAVITVLTALTAAALTAYAPVLIGRSVDVMTGVGGVDFATLGRYLALLAATVALAAICSFLTGVVSKRIGQRTALELRRELSHKIQYAPLSYLDSSSVGDNTARLTQDVTRVAEGVSEGVYQFVNGICAIVFTLVFMLRMNITLALVVIILTPLSVAVCGAIGKRLQATYSARAELKGEMTGYIAEKLSAFATIKEFNAAGYAVKGYTDMNDKLYRVGFKAQFAGSLVNPVTRFINGLVYVAVIGVGAYLITDTATTATLTIGGLSAFLAYANSYSKPFNEITGILGDMLTASSSYDRIQQLLSQPDTGLAGEVLADPQGNIEFRSVDFSYVSDKPLIKDFNLSVAAGQRVAIVGHTGAGKTTIINLLMRFLEPQAGCICLDGERLDHYTAQSIRAAFGMVLQESWIFTGTVYENIAFHNETATREKVEALCRSIGIDGIIDRMPNGYDTILSDDGSLSAGEKQLLNIARVMLSDPAMLLLDEATSDIDTRQEQLIQAAFLNLVSGKTSFIVAHRLSTIKNADIILVMQHGNVVEQGTHEELLAKGGVYSEMYNTL